MGAAIGPKEVIDQITKLNTNMEACTSHFLQHASVECLEKRKQTDQFLFDMLAELKDRRDLLVKMVNEVPGFSCFTPPSTFYLCVKVTKVSEIQGETDGQTEREGEAYLDGWMDVCVCVVRRWTCWGSRPARTSAAPTSPRLACRSAHANTSERHSPSTP